MSRAAACIAASAVLALGACASPSADAEATDSADSSQSGEPEHRLRVLSYNVAIGRESSLDTIAAVVNSAEPDVAGLQELDRFTNRSGADVDQVAVLAEATGMTAVFIKTTDWDGGEFGMALLLRPPLAVVSQAQQELPLPEGGETRWVLTLGVDADGDPSSAEFELSVTHLSPYSEPNRVAQAQALRALGETGPALLLGDLNASPSSAPLAELAQSFELAGNFGGAQIDYVLHDRNADWSVIEARQLDAGDHPQAETASDHPAVLAVYSPAW